MRCILLLFEPSMGRLPADVACLRGRRVQVRGDEELPPLPEASLDPGDEDLSLHAGERIAGEARVLHSTLRPSIGGESRSRLDSPRSPGHLGVLKARR